MDRLTDPSTSPLRGYAQDERSFPVHPERSGAESKGREPGEGADRPPVGGNRHNVHHPSRAARPPPLFPGRAALPGGVQRPRQFGSGGRARNPPQSPLLRGKRGSAGGLRGRGGAAVLVMGGATVERAGGAAAPWFRDTPGWVDAGAGSCIGLRSTVRNPAQPSTITEKRRLLP